ncbi:MAG TPA: class I SAM-dependent methyltransferase [Casimicrobiaceae bacterium]|nr:class I SAM-dependent methyltransferase [Casimicrobiaceae bacterium]
MTRAKSAAFPPGHFYSPVVDPDRLEPARVWPQHPAVHGIDFNDESHAEILTRDFPRFHPLYDYPDEGLETPTLNTFFTNNSQFSWLDSRALFVLLQAWSPRRVIEVGSGFSSLLIADVNRRRLDCGVDVTCIEPYPRSFLRNRVSGLSRLIEAKVQDVPMAEFARLQAGDVLFIDSSHVAKTGSDVNFLYFEVLPQLAAGVNIHVHDVFLPHDYPRDWVLNENRSWNEQYLLRALLMYSGAFRVVFGCSYAFWRFPELVKTALAFPDGRAFAGGSFWMRRL